MYSSFMDLCLGRGGHLIFQHQKQPLLLWLWQGSALFPHMSLNCYFHLKNVGY